MQYMLHNGPYRARRQKSLWAALGTSLASGYTIALRCVLIACVAFGFFQLVALLLTLSDSLLVEVLALAAWACGAIPLVYHLWHLELGSKSSATEFVYVQLDDVQSD